MFSFHKPKIYRSNLGCCICKAKSSSSRFTDSKKYENEFERCFRIQEKRSGEICNACVLLVKRWKKLSPENRLTKHWHHVVDARAGPGTKLTSQRRLNSHNNNSSGSSGSSGNNSNSQDSSSSSSGTGSRRQQQARPDALPLSSSQQLNSQQSSAHQPSSPSAPNKRIMNSINRARAIDTNVSTFTFGEPPQRRNYMTQEPSYFASYSSNSPNSFVSSYKPQSALNSSAFESVIKRFRQRQQQQKLEAQKRLQSRQQRQQQQAKTATVKQQPAAAENNSKATRKQLPSQQVAQTEPETEEANNWASDKQQQASSKRLKRSSESLSSLSIDGIRVASLLDSSVWRKEKICCGIIFRGLHNEVAVLPKLLKPCQCRLQKLSSGPSAKVTGSKADLLLTRRGGSSDEDDEEDEEEEDDEAEEEEDDEEEGLSPIPPPRAQKSGSISSCDSNTSGTGSMEQPEAEAGSKKPVGSSIAAASVPLSAKTAGSGRKTATAAASKQASASKQRRPARSSSGRAGKLAASAASAADNTDSSSSSSLFTSGQQQHNPQSSPSSEFSSSSRLLMTGEEDMDDEEDMERLLMADEEDSNTDSSLEGLAELERKKSSGVVGAMG